MANRHRGEIEAELGGVTYVLCLTLGALAELEGAYGDQDLIAIAERFETGRIAASDAIKIIGAGLRGLSGSRADVRAVAHLRLKLSRLAERTRAGGQCDLPGRWPRAHRRCRHADG